MSDRHGVDLIIDEARRAARRDHARHPRPADEPRRSPCCASRSCPASSAAGSSWAALPGPRQHAPTTEWNIHCDPEAAKIAFRPAFARSDATRRPAPLALGSTSPSRRVRARPLVALARRAGSRPDDSIALAAARTRCGRAASVAANPIVRYLADALRFYMEFHARYDGFYGAFIHDPLALAAALDPSLVDDRGGPRRRRDRAAR